MSGDFTAVCSPSGGGGSGIDVAALPPLPDPDVLDTHVADMLASGAAFHNGVRDAARHWSGLEEFYRTPDAAQVLGAFTPIVARSQRVADLASMAAKTLYAYADRARDFKTRINRLRAEVQALDAVILANDDWHSKAHIVDTHQQVMDAASALAQAILDSDAQCATDISRLTGGPGYTASHVPRVKAFASTDQLSNSFTWLQHQLGTDAALPDLPWGKQVSIRHEGFLSGMQGFGTAAVGAAQGLYTLAATKDKNEQLRAWHGIGALGQAVFTTKAVIDRGFTDVTEQDINALLTTVDAIKDTIHAEEWGTDPWRAGGQTVFDLASMAAGGSGIGAEAGTMAAKLGLAAEKLSIAAMDHPGLVRFSETLTDVANGLHNAGLFLDKPGSTLLKLSDVAMPETTARALDGLTRTRINAWKMLDKATNASADLFEGAQRTAADGMERFVDTLRQADAALPQAVQTDPSGALMRTAGSGGAAPEWLDAKATALREHSQPSAPPRPDTGNPLPLPIPVTPDAFPVRNNIAHRFLLRHGDAFFPVSRKDNFAARTSLHPNSEYIIDHRTKTTDDGGKHTVDTLEKFFTDGTGRVDRVDTYAGVKGAWSTELNKRMPNVTYNVVAKCDGGLENHFTYITDDFAKPVSVEAHITGLLRGDMNRSAWQQFLSGRRVGGPDYEGGHLIASLFAGPGEGANLLAQLMFQNRGYGTPNVGPGAMAFYQLERELMTKALVRVDNGLPLDLRIKVEAIPGPKPGLPESLRVLHAFDRGSFLKNFFPNLMKSE
ncbi:DNA/RNA non-specific endonuclease [Paenarthrobacter sp. NPDC090520]|uniref:DNA/RNA non-specific endonuclease n=1 Tax=unclassified Paenarthrobacter TaxID=2634190 RepID=UPI0038079224